MFSGLQAKIIAALAVIVGLITTIAGVYFKGKSTGANEVKVDATEDALKRAVKADKVEDDVEKITDSDIDAALDEWMRDDTDKRV